MTSMIYSTEEVRRALTRCQRDSALPLDIAIRTKNTFGGAV
jgi:hypothetical protein